MFKFDKRTILEFGGIIAFMVLWYFVLMPVWNEWRARNRPPPPPPDVTEERPAGRGQTPALVEDPAPERPILRKEKEPEDFDRFSAETDEFRFEFCSVGASIERGSLKGYHIKRGDESPLPVLDVLSRDEAGPVRSFVVRNFTLADLEHKNWSYKLTGGRAKLVEFDLEAEGVEIRKRFTLPREGLAFGIELTFTNVSEAPVSDLVFDLWGPAGIVPDESPGSSSRFLTLQAVLLAHDSKGKRFKEMRNPSGGKFLGLLGKDGLKTLFSRELEERVKAREEERRRKLSDEEEKALEEQVHAEGYHFLSKEVIEWAAVRNRYFGCFLIPDREPETIKALADYVEPSDEGKGKPPRLARGNVTCGLRVAKFDLDPGVEKTFRFRVYLGPMSESIMAPYSEDDQGNDRFLRSAVVYGWSMFAWLSRLLLYILKFFHFFTKYLGSVIGGYGLAIILLTFLVRGGMHPLQKRMFMVQQKMASLGPEVKRIEAKYKKLDSPEAQRKMQAEKFELYKREGANPLSGCWPMLIQMPMFIAFFGALRGAFELRQAGYLWIPDLSLPDHFLGITLPLPNAWPFGGPKPLNILPVLWAGLTFLQQKLAPKSADAQQQQQRTMMYMMPLFFLFIFYSMPSGLVLYFVCSSLVGMLGQWYTRRTFKLSEAAPPPEDAPKAVKTAWDREAKQQKKQIERAKKRKDRKKNRLFPP